MRYELGHLYNQDCLEAMREMPDNFFELALVDPPYGIGESGKGNSSRSNLATAADYKPYAGEDKEPPSPKYFSELLRVSRNQIIWGANHFISRIPLDSPSWVVWNKLNGSNDFADCELAWTSFKGTVRRFDYRWHGMLQHDMKNKEVRIHPNQKPVDLYRWLLTRYAKEGDKILDTHAGSASSLIACHDLGFEFMGFELDEDYHEQAQLRLTNHQKQGKLF